MALTKTVEFVLNPNSKDTIYGIYTHPDGNKYIMYQYGEVWRPVAQLSFGWTIHAGDTNDNWLYFNDSAFTVKGTLKYSQDLLNEISFVWEDNKYDTFLNFCYAFIEKFPIIGSYKEYREPIIQQKIQNFKNK